MDILYFGRLGFEDGDGDEWVFMNELDDIQDL